MKCYTNQGALTTVVYQDVHATTYTNMH